MKRLQTRALRMAFSANNAAPKIMGTGALDGSGDTAIHPQVLARDVTSTSGGEKGDHRRDFVGAAIAAHRDALPESRLLWQAVDKARQHVVHAHVVGGVPVGEQLG